MEQLIKGSVLRRPCLDTVLHGGYHIDEGWYINVDEDWPRMAEHLGVDTVCCRSVSLGTQRVAVLADTPDAMIEICPCFKA